MLKKNRPRSAGAGDAEPSVVRRRRAGDAGRQADGTVADRHGTRGASLLIYSSGPYNYSSVWSWPIWLWTYSYGLYSYDPVL